MKTHEFCLYMLLVSLLSGVLQAQVTRLPPVVMERLPPVVKPVPLGTAYACTGVLDGKAYALALELTPLDDGFQLTWVAQGQKLFVGYALRHDNHLAAFSIDQRTNGMTLIAYRIEPGTLNGRWFAGDGIAHTELCLAGKPA